MRDVMLGSDGGLKGEGKEMNVFFYTRLSREQVIKVQSHKLDTPFSPPAWSVISCVRE